VKRIEQGPVKPEQSSELNDSNVDLQEAVRRRAYQIYEERGTEAGSEMGDWLQAEAELLDAHDAEIDSENTKKAA
jgi:Protein of unknown function (DUF2934)